MTPFIGQFVHPVGGEGLKLSGWMRGIEMQKSRANKKRF